MYPLIRSQGFQDRSTDTKLGSFRKRSESVGADGVSKIYGTFSVVFFKDWEKERGTLESIMSLLSD